MLGLIDSLLHGLEELIFHIEVHIGDKVVDNILGFLDLGQVVFELDVFHHVSFLKY